MPREVVNGHSLSYEIIGEGRPWVLTPGGRFSKDFQGVRELAEAIAAYGNQVLIWDRPNCGESDVVFEGGSESEMQADACADLLRHLGMAPAVVIGGSGGARVSLLTVARHPDVASALAVWWISGGVHGLLSLASHYCLPSIAAAWENMESVAALPDWTEVIERNPGNRQRILDQDREQFIATMERWAMAYCPREGELVPGLNDEMAKKIRVPTLVFRSGASDSHHTRATSEAVAKLLPSSTLVEPPWGDREWVERMETAEERGLFGGWPLLAPTLRAWVEEVLD